MFTRLRARPARLSRRSNWNPAILFEKSRGKAIAPSTVMMARQKNPHAMALGRLGGLKGGRARAEKLSARRRRQIARLAAQARWRQTRAA
jgi:hypothetical protein